MTPKWTQDWRLYKQSIKLLGLSLTYGTGVLHLIQINHQPNAIIFQFFILTFVYSSTSFGRFPANHQELNDCSGSLCFYLCIVVIFGLFSWSGWPPGRRFPAHYQHVNDWNGSLWFYLRIVVTVVLCSWSGLPAVPPEHEHTTTITTIRR
jgi:hypothetical protein